MQQTTTALLAWVLFLTGCETQPPQQSKAGTAIRNNLQRFESAHACMGMEFRATVWCESELVAGKAFDAAWYRADRLDALLSDYRADSAASQLAKSAPHAIPVTIDPELWSLIRSAREIGKRTDDAFDITIGPSSHLWRSAIRRNRLPTEVKITEALARTGWDNLEIHPDNQVRLLMEGMILDFGGIGQGYAADCIAEIFQEHGIDSAIIDASGDVVVLGHPPDPQTAWTVSIPGRKSIEAMLLKIPLGAVTSSGDLQQSLTIGGQTWSHLVDPRSGWATTHSTLVTVIAPNGMLADALASAFSVLPTRRAMEIAESWEGVDTRLVVRDPESESGLAIHQTTGFKRFVAE